MASIKLAEVVLGDSDSSVRINDNFQLIEGAIGRIEAAIAVLREEIEELRGASDQSGPLGPVAP